MAMSPVEVSDHEVALPVHELASCAAGTVHGAGVERNARHDQLSSNANLCRDLFSQTMSVPV